MQAEAAARELPTLSEADTLALVLLMLDERDRRFEPAAVKWLGGWFERHPRIGLELAGELVDGLGELQGVAPDVARARAALLLRSAGAADAAQLMERW